MPNFKTRSYQKELMDDLTLNSDALRQNLEELSVINYWLGGNLVLKLALQRLKRQGFFKENRTYTIADIGSGGGDNLLTLAKWFKKNGIKTQITGIDANIFMIDFAKKRCKNYPNINFQQQNIFEPAIDKLEFDITTCSLFCHHFTDTELSTIFQQIKKITNHYFIIWCNKLAGI